MLPAVCCSLVLKSARATQPTAFIAFPCLSSNTCTGPAVTHLEECVLYHVFRTTSYHSGPVLIPSRANCCMVSPAFAAPQQLSLKLFNRWWQEWKNSKTHSLHLYHDCKYCIVQINQGTHTIHSFIHTLGFLIDLNACFWVVGKKLQKFRTHMRRTVLCVPTARQQRLSLCLCGPLR